MDPFMLKIFLAVSSGVSSLAIVLALVTLAKQSSLKRLTVEQKSRYKKLNKRQLSTQEAVEKLKKAQEKFSLVEAHHQRLDALEQQNETFKDKLDAYHGRLSRVEARESQSGSYQQAAKLVELGAQEDEVATTCGLSRAEADLVALVNRHQTMRQNTTTTEESSPKRQEL